MKDGGAAFPQIQLYDEEGRLAPVVLGGMSLLDWFAGQALVGLVREWQDGSQSHPVPCSQDAYAYADAMILEKNRREFEQDRKDGK